MALSQKAWGKKKMRNGVRETKNIYIFFTLQENIFLFSFYFLWDSLVRRFSSI